MHEHEKDILTMRQGQDARRLKKKKKSRGQRSVGYWNKIRERKTQ